MENFKVRNIFLGFIKKAAEQDLNSLVYQEDPTSDQDTKEEVKSTKLNFSQQCLDI